MKFDNITPNNYLNEILLIIREGILLETPKMKISEKETKKNQALAEVFNIIGTSKPKNKIGASQEHIGKASHREDIYFYLCNDNRTRLFYIEAKRLPKPKSTDQEDYIIGKSTSGNPCGGIERFKLGIHGHPLDKSNNGLIGYIENKSINEWETFINQKILSEYPDDTKLIKKSSPINEYHSSHTYTCDVEGIFNLHHFLIDLTKNIK